MASFNKCNKCGIFWFFRNVLKVHSIIFLYLLRGSVSNTASLIKNQTFTAFCSFWAFKWFEGPYGLIPKTHANPHIKPSDLILTWE